MANTTFAAFIAQAVIVPFHNYSGSDIVDGALLKPDTGNVGTATTAPGYIPTAASTDVGVAVCVGVAKAGGSGKMAITGGYPVTAKGAVTHGDVIMPGSTSGTCSTQTAGKAQAGTAYGSAVDGAQFILLIAPAKNA